MQVVLLLQLVQTYTSMSTQSYFFFFPQNQWNIQNKVFKGFQIHFPASLICLTAIKNIKYSVHYHSNQLRTCTFQPSIVLNFREKHENIIILIVGHNK